MRVNTAFVGTYYTAASSKQTEEAGGSYEAFMSAVEAVKEAHKLTPTNIKQEDDWRKMTDREWDKLVEHIDRVLEAERENLEELKDLQAQAEQKAAANAPASMKSIMAGQAALKVAANGYFAGFTSGKEATELEKSSWTYDLETDDQVLLAKAKLANERAASFLRFY